MSAPRNRPSRGAGRAAPDPLDLSDLLLKSVPPHNLDAERAVLGGVLLRPDILDGLAPELRERDFYKPAHRVVWAAMVDLWRASQPVDVVSLADALTRAGTLDAAGGPACLAELMGSVMTAANARAHAKIVRDMAGRRAMLAMGARMIEIGFDLARDPADFADIAGLAVDQVLGSRAEIGPETPAEYIAAHGDYLEQALEGQQPGVPLPWWRLQDMLGGARPGEVIIVGARPGCGKTALALQWALHAAKNGCASGFFSLEMGFEQLLNRAAAMECEIDMQRFRSSPLNLTDEEWSRVAALHNSMEHWPLYLYDRPLARPSDIRAACRRWRRAAGRLDIIFIDYAQLIGPDGRHATREQEVSAVARDLKCLAKDFGMAVVALAQLNRKVEDRKPPRPGALPRPYPSDLRECGELEHVADCIMLIPPWHMREVKSDVEFFDFVVAKGRNSRTGDVRLAFDRKHTKFDQKDDLF